MDIDIDTPSDFDPTAFFPSITRALKVDKDGKLKPHPCGVYFQRIATEPLTGNNLAAIPFERAEDEGYTKIDFLHLGILDGLHNKRLVRKLVRIEPNWDLLLDDDIIPSLFHLRNWGKELKIIKPRSIEEVADCLALIRPGKRKLVDYYREKTEWVRSILYQPNEDETYSFKRSHAIAYAHVIVLQLHLIQANLNETAQ